jgi:hypothetical protein
VTRIAWLTAAVCFVMALVLVVRALRRIGPARLALRAIGVDIADRTPGMRKLVGVLEPAAAVLVAPFTDRPALYARARLRGVGPEGGAVRVLWDKVLFAPVKLCDGDAVARLTLDGAEVLVPREYRHATLRALVGEVRLVPRVLARAGFSSAPPPNRWFLLDEEALRPGDRVCVIGEYDRKGNIRGTPGHPLVVSNLTPWRIVLRLAWGPALALLMALIVTLTGAAVLGTWWWLR